MTATQFLSSFVKGQEGIALVNKPSGVTSHDVVNRVRRVTGIKRVGHAGTLDPLADGLLIILVGREFTKLQSQFLHMDKTYEVKGRLGVVSDTYDIEGKLESWKAEKTENRRTGKQEKSPLIKGSIPQGGGVQKNHVDTLLPKYTGLIYQTVPPFSAVKRQGKKLYELARAGQEIDNLPVRQVKIHEIKFINFDASAQEFTLKVHCSSGTYIRSLIHDIGQDLGVGAVVVELRRTKIGPYSLANSLSIV